MAETRALIARGSTPPPPARAKLMNRAIRDLKNAGLLTNTKIRGLYVHAAHEAQLARQNWIENASNLTVVGGMTFTVDRGYAGDGGSAELSTTGTISSASHCSGIWVNNYAGSSGFIEAGGINGFLRTTAANLVGSWGSTGPSSVAGAGAYGVMATDDSAATLRFYKNGALLSSPASGIFSLSSGAIHIALGYSARHAVTHWGPNLTTGEVATLYGILNTYLTAIGAA